MDSLELGFEPGKHGKTGRVRCAFLDAPAEMIPALQFFGEDPDSHDPDVIAKAEAVLWRVRPTYQSSTALNTSTRLANGDICVHSVGLVTSCKPVIVRAKLKTASKSPTTPQRGRLMWFDQMAIPVDAPNPDAAHKFLNFIMDAQNMAAASNYVYYANGNKASQEFLVEDVIGDPAIYPDEATLENLYTTTPYPPKVQRVVTRLWTKIKSGT